MSNKQEQESALIYFSCRHVKYNLVHGPYDPLSGSIFQIFDLLMTIFKAIADVPVESFKAVKATKTASTSSDFIDKAVPSGSSARLGDWSYDATRQLSSSNDINKAQTIPITQNTVSVEPGFLMREMSATTGYSAEDESEDELEADLDVAELPGEPIHEDFLTRSSSDTNLESIVRDRRTPTSDNDQFSVMISGTRTGFKYVGNAVRGAQVGLSKSVNRLTLEGLKAPFVSLSLVAYGFHNAPKLWGDDVRPLDRITGTGSGLKAAGKVSQ